VPDLKSVLTWSAVAAGVAIAAERRVARMRTDAGDSMLDWELVRRTAYSRCGADGGDEVAAAGADYDPLVAELVPLLAQACGTGAQGANFGRVQVVGRRGFVDQNLAMMRRMMVPLEQGGLAAMRPSPLVRVPASIYLGTLLGYMGRRVLGQYDPVLSLDPESAEGLPRPALLIIEPNVREFERRSNLPLGSLRRWLMLHELTHAWQFELHPWLAPHLTGLIKELSHLPGGGGSRGLEELLRTARNLRPQLAMVGRVQAVMAVLEGHGNFIMREVGKRHLADFETLDEAFHHRQEQPSATDRLLLIISGITFKLQQYQQGERFLRAVQAVGGQPALDRVWSGAEELPSWTEVRRPELWLQRQQFTPGPGRDAWPRPAPAPV